MPEGAALSWSFSDIVIRRKGRLAFGYRVPGCSLLYHGLRRDELCKLKVKDMQPRHGVAHLRVTGKGEKIRYVPLHLAAGERIHEYLGGSWSRRRREWRPLPAGSQQPHSPARPGGDAGWRLLAGSRLLDSARLRHRRACTARDRRYQRARPRGRHRQGAGVARPRQHRHRADLRPSQNPPRRQPASSNGRRSRARKASSPMPSPQGSAACDRGFRPPIRWHPS